MGRSIIMRILGKIAGMIFGGKILILFLILFAVMIVFGAIGSINSNSPDVAQNIYRIAINRVRIDLDIQNTLDYNVLQLIDMHRNHRFDSEDEVVEWIIAHFVVFEYSYEYEEVEDGGDGYYENEDEEYGANRVRIYTYRFMFFEEIVEVLRFYPFYFEEHILEQFETFIDQNFRDRVGQQEFSGTYPWPIVGRVTSFYGMRECPTRFTMRMHHGIDFAGAERTEIFAITYGEVARVRTGVNSGYGNYVIIRHEESGFYTLYAHLHAVYVEVGDMVEPLEVIGRQGGGRYDNNPGDSTGAHLHFEIRRTIAQESSLDPALFLRSQP